MGTDPPSQLPGGVARIPQGDEAELAARARAGDRAAFGTLVERFAPQARRVARAPLQNPDDTDDAAQGALPPALVELDQYGPPRPLRPLVRRVVAHASTDRPRLP